jgi:hypothetical protein
LSAPGPLQSSRASAGICPSLTLCAGRLAFNGQQRRPHNMQTAAEILTVLLIFATGFLLLAL